MYVSQHMYINAPTMEVAAPTVFMVWLRAWFPVNNRALVTSFRMTAPCCYSNAKDVQRRTMCHCMPLLCFVQVMHHCSTRYMSHHAKAVPQDTRSQPLSYYTIQWQTIPKKLTWQFHRRALARKGYYELLFFLCFFHLCIA